MSLRENSPNTIRQNLQPTQSYQTSRILLDKRANHTIDERGTSVQQSKCSKNENVVPIHFPGLNPTQPDPDNTNATKTIIPRLDALSLKPAITC
ncbi:MAG TPA: hypothetical protein VLV18_07510 [Terriglobales bacterium]|nr:hypothetical protein [Terriglobales bacterium]